MSADIKQELSALMDGEADRDSARFVLRSVDRDQALAAAWTRYHVARDCLRQQPIVSARAGFADSVMARLEAESAAPATDNGRHWLRYAGGGAIAAAVAAIAVIASNPAQPPPVPSAPGMVAATTAPPVAAPIQPAVPYNESALLPAVSPALSQPVSATISGRTYFAPGYLAAPASKSLRAAEPAIFTTTNANGVQYVLMIVPGREARPVDVDASRMPPQQ
ncbi:sigma-E factor negative regulatory protein [Tahibacter amnicola]|uniref:Sigma-E factor negative regulatory protein n=1 Tax=Tahibacter amnicola TaxID=2976241 RepID=A0ABY6BIG6_9GAMM|nr:sigma-E factor negative regulatory protein [Tahibacter amnicola]UXI69659.1 sigma-E factor negative regulatory protein [Tahibacter amnicola]